MESIALAAATPFLVMLLFLAASSLAGPVRAASRGFAQACVAAAGAGTRLVVLSLARSDPAAAWIVSPEALALILAAGAFLAAAGQPALPPWPPERGERAALALAGTVPLVLALAAIPVFGHIGPAALYAALALAALVMGAAPLYAAERLMSLLVLAAGWAVLGTESALGTPRLLALGLGMAALLAVALSCKAARAARTSRRGRFRNLLGAMGGLGLAASGMSPALAASAAGLAEHPHGRGADSRRIPQAWQDTAAFAAGLAVGFPPLAALGTSAAMGAAAILAFAARWIAVGLGGRPQDRPLALPHNGGALALAASLGRVELAAGLVLALAAAGLAEAAYSLFKRRLKTQGAPLRPIAAIGKRESTPGVLRLARDLGAQNEPVRAVCVAAARGTAGFGLADAEDALVNGVAAGAAGGMRVLPSIVVAASPADGLARAVLERGADSLVLGWRRLSEADVEGPLPALDALAEATSVLIFSARNPDAMADSRRLVAAYAEGTQTHPYFSGAVSALGRIAGPGAKFELWPVGGNDASGQGQAGSPSWRTLAADLKARGAGTASLAVVGARPGSAGWSPLTARLAGVLEDAFPGNPLVAVYLPEDAPESAALQGSAADSEDRGERSLGALPPLVAAALEAGRVKTGMDEAALVDALPVLTAAVLPGNADASLRLANRFSTEVRRQPILLEPGVLLVHAHIPGIPEPILAIGARADGWRLAALPEHPDIVAVLCSPEDQGPSVHLQALTELARAFRDSDLAGFLRSGGA